MGMVKNLPANARDIGDVGSIPRSGRSLGRGSGNPLQYSCLDNPMDGGAWQTSLWGGNVSDTTEWLSTQHTHTPLTPPIRDWPLFLSPFSFEVSKKKKGFSLFFAQKYPFGHDAKPRGNFKNLILG